PEDVKGFRRLGADAILRNSVTGEHAPHCSAGSVGSRGQRVVNYRTGGEIPGALGVSRHGCVDGEPCAPAETLLAHEEERLILYDGSAQSAAKLIPLEFRERRGAEEIPGVKIV